MDFSAVTDDHGVPITNLICIASSAAGSVYGDTGSNGMLNIPVFAGIWNLYLGTTNLVFPEVPAFTITNGVNFTYNIVARTITGQISGAV